MKFIRIIDLFTGCVLGYNVTHLDIADTTVL